MGSRTYADGRIADRNLTGFGNSDITASSGNLNARSSYLPPQVASPEVRAARYRVIDNSRTPSSNDHYGNQGNARTMGMDRNRTRSYDRAPMKPIVEARRSFLPSEPTGYNYNANSTRAARPARRQITRRPVVKRAPAAFKERQSAAFVNKNGAVTVAPGDTLYSISRRHNVSVMKLMDLNNLSDSSLFVGQQIALPKGAGAPVIARRAIANTGRVLAAASSGTYTVRSGENFQAIARKLGVNSAKLADLNGITDPRSIRAGEVLILPTIRKAVVRPKKVASLGTPNVRNTLRARGSMKNRKASDLKVRKVKTKAISLGSTKRKLGSIKRKISTKRKMTSVSKTSQKARLAPGKAKPKGLAAFRWPVRGRIIGKFGPRADGTNNDGINLAVPIGTRVKAAEGGIVAYAGSELKGYGNLVLIRHANNWVSAYAHNGKLLVKRGDKIKRGQVVARAGTSGSVNQPQVHFELRKGSKPVDPLKYMVGS